MRNKPTQVRCSHWRFIERFTWKNMDSRTRPLIGWRNLAIRRRHLLRCHFFLHFLCVCVFLSFFSLSLSLLSTKISSAMCRRGMMSRLRSSFIFFNSLGTSYLPVGWDYERVRTPSLTFFFAFKAFLLVTFWPKLDSNAIQCLLHYLRRLFFLNWGRCRV